MNEWQCPLGINTYEICSAGTCYTCLASRVEHQQNRIAELEVLLRRAADDIGLGWLTIPDVEKIYNTDGSWHIVQDIHAALRGKTDG
jgi:hypothetical protein